MIETSRVEINRKNDQLTQLRSELDSVLYKKVARSVSKKDLEQIMHRTRPRPNDILKMNTNQKAMLKKPVEKASIQNTDINVGNRQIDRKRKAEDSLKTSKKEKSDESKSDIKSELVKLKP